MAEGLNIPVVLSPLGVSLCACLTAADARALLGIGTIEGGDVPIGGGAGDLLAKLSGTDLDVGWASLIGLDHGGTGANLTSVGANGGMVSRAGSTLTVSSVLQEVSSRIGIAVASPTAKLHLPAGSAGSYSAPLKFDVGVLQTLPEAGAMEFDGVHLHFTIAATRYQIDQQGTGSVSSVGLAAPSQFAVTNSPVTSAGTLTLGWNTQTANTVLAGPAGAPAAAPTFRSLAADDIPGLPASKITSGQLLSTRGGTGADLSAAGADGGFVFRSGTALSVSSVLQQVSNRIGVGMVAPTAWVHLQAGAAAASSAPLKFSTGTNLTTPENGALEFDGSHLYLTISGVRYQMDRTLWDDITSKPSTFAPIAHDLVSSTHTATGLTTGHFLKATGATTFGFGAHGLSYGDVGAAASGHNHSGIYEPVIGVGTSAQYWRGDKAWTTFPTSMTPTAHQLDGALHTASGLTTGHFLKATGATTFGFGAHGLTCGDIGAAAAGHTHALTDANITGILTMAKGGSSANLTAVNGGLVYSTASALAITTALSGVLQGNGTAAPTAITGTTNYLTKWGASPRLGNSQIYDSGTYVGIGRTTGYGPAPFVQVQGYGGISVIAETYSFLTAFCIANAAVSSMQVCRARGAIGTETALLSGDAIGLFEFRGYKATGWSTLPNAAIYGVADENWTDTSTATYLAFYTCPTGAAYNVERWRIGSTGILQSNGAQTIATSAGALTIQPTTHLVLSPGAGSAVCIGGTVASGLINVQASNADVVMSMLAGPSPDGAETIGRLCKLEFKFRKNRSAGVLGGGHIASRAESNYYSSTTDRDSALDFATMWDGTESVKMTLTSAGVLQLGSILATSGNLALSATSGSVHVTKLSLVAGTATAAPLTFASGTNLTTPANGAIEFNGSHLYLTISGVRYQMDRTLWDDITSKPSTFAPSSHEHSALAITSGTLPIGRGGTSNTAFTSSKFIAYNGTELASTSYEASSFATAGHNHDGAYAALGHNHDGAYAPVSHSHGSVSGSFLTWDYDPMGPASAIRFTVTNGIVTTFERLV